MFDSSVIIIIVVLLFSVIFHEVAHGWVAFKLGDPTAKNLGRLTLDPIPHIDPIMTIIVPIFLYMTMGFAFGGAKPVPVNPYNFKNPKRDMALVAAAGPASNLILAIVAIILYKIFLSFGILEPMTNSRFYAEDISLLENLFQFTVIINVVLMVFNLFPIPPLDGSKILMGFLSHENAMKFESFSRYGFIIIIGIILLGDVIHFSILGSVINPVINFSLNLLF